LVCLRVLDHPQRFRIEPRRLDEWLGQRGVSADLELLYDLVLEQPMDDDHVRSQQLFPPGDFLTDRQALVSNELQVQVGDSQARIALAGSGLPHVAPATPEAEIAALDRVEQLCSVELVSRREAEGGVAFELR